MEILAYILMLAVGLSLGIIGSGGSILTVPILVYLFGINPILATSYSLFIVGLTSLIGAIRFFKQGLIDIKTTLLFAFPSVLSVLLTRKYIVPNIPDTLITINDFSLTKDIFIMLFFSILMISSSYYMIKGRKESVNDNKGNNNRYLLIAIYGILIGLLTGILGVGGGFLIIPAIVFLLQMPMKNAVATSLSIIALNSLIGFTGDIGHFQINWIFIISLSLISIIGIIIGSLLSKKIHHKFSNNKMKKVFGYFILLMGFYIIIKEIF